jgi:uncharacterized protein (DUF1697 family)
MPAFIALLRGVNVGKAKRVPMAEFRKLLEGLGYTSVVTLLNSGNAVFCAPSGTSKNHASDIAATILRKLKVEVPVIVKTATELAAIVAENPFTVEDPERSRMLVAFTQDRNGLASVSLISTLVSSREKFLAGRHAAYLYCVDGILESKAGAALLGKAGKDATTRNLATTLKLYELSNATGVKVAHPRNAGDRHGE